MNIIIKKKYLYIDEFKLKCCLGKKGIKKNKVEGDGSTPSGKYGLGMLYFRKDRVNKPECLLSTRAIKKNYGWCDDPKSKHYNKFVKFNLKTKFRYEKLFRKDHKYDYFILIKYNYIRSIKNAGSAIFLHLTKDYSPTKGCIALKKKDFIIICKLINNKTNIIIN